MDYPLKAPKRDKVIIVKVSEAERYAIKERAGVHTDGNVSHWIRKASISYEPERAIDPRDPGC